MVLDFWMLKVFQETLWHRIIDESSEHIGASNGTTDFWIIETEEKHKAKGFHRKATGINHISFKANSKEDVDKFSKEFLNKNKIKPLYQTPKHFPEYIKDYYAVFFEDPDRIKIELTYMPHENQIPK